MKSCTFCNGPSSHKLFFIIEEDNRGVYLHVCDLCSMSMSLSKETVCDGHCKCMILHRGTLLINPRVAHIRKRHCNKYDYLNEHPNTELVKFDIYHDVKSYTVFYNPLSCVYEITDLSYDQGPEGFAKTLLEIDLNDIETILKLINRSSLVDLSHHDIVIDGYQLLDWAIINGHTTFIEAIGKSGRMLSHTDNMFALAVKNERVDILRLLIKYKISVSNMIYDEETDRYESVYSVGMRSKNNEIKKLLLYASIDSEMQRILKLDIDNLDFSSLGKL